MVVILDATGLAMPSVGRQVLAGCCAPEQLIQLASLASPPGTEGDMSRWGRVGAHVGVGRCFKDLVKRQGVEQDCPTAAASLHPHCHQHKCDCHGNVQSHRPERHDFYELLSGSRRSCPDLGGGYWPPIVAPVVATPMWRWSAQGGRQDRCARRQPSNFMSMPSESAAIRGDCVHLGINGD